MVVSVALLPVLFAAVLPDMVLPAMVLEALGAMPLVTHLLLPAVMPLVPTQQVDILDLADFGGESQADLRPAPAAIAQSSFL
jgi:hypothetical protein